MWPTKYSVRREIRQRLKATEHTLYIIQYIYIIYYGQIPQIRYCIFHLLQTEHKTFIWVTAWGQSIWSQGAFAGSEILFLCNGFAFTGPTALIDWFIFLIWNLQPIFFTWMRKWGSMRFQFRFEHLILEPSMPDLFPTQAATRTSQWIKTFLNASL